jgi:hypothetical protein
MGLGFLDTCPAEILIGRVVVMSFKSIMSEINTCFISALSRHKTQGKYEVEVD